MKKKLKAAARYSKVGALTQSIGPLVEQVRSLVQSARRAAAASVNTLQVATNFEIGRLIVEHEQQGTERAAYGKETLKHLSGSLTLEFGRGFSEDNLSNMRKFYVLWKDRVSPISEKASRKLPPAPIRQKLSDELPAISATPSRKFTLSWSHYVVLLSIKDPGERSFLRKGFLFEARQKRFTFGEDHYFVDLVFYNRLLRAYVLLDLKIANLTHQDVGQMQMYVNHFDRCVKRDDEHPTVGIILCKKKHDALVEITLPGEANIYASEYRLYLPSKEELRQRLLEWTRPDAGNEEGAADEA